MIATAPPLTRILPAALRLTAIVLSRASPGHGEHAGAGDEEGGDGGRDSLAQLLERHDAKPPLGLALASESNVPIDRSAGATCYAT